MEDSLAETLYDLVRTEQFVPFSILFASGQRFKIKSRDHIGLGPVNRSDVEKLKTVIGWAVHTEPEGQCTHQLVQIVRYKLPPESSPAQSRSL